MPRGKWLEGMSFHFFRFPMEDCSDMHISDEERPIYAENNEKIEKLILKMQDVLNKTDIRYTVSKFKWRIRIYIPKELVHKVDRELFDRLLKIEKEQKGIIAESCEQLKVLQKG